MNVTVDDARILPTDCHIKLKGINEANIVSSRADLIKVL